MKTFLQVIAGLLLLPACSPAEDKIDFGLSTAVARKVNATERETYESEFGDANGPFRRIGSVVANSAGVDHFSASVDAGDSQTNSRIKDPNTLLHIEFFVNEKGNGFGVVHHRPVEKPTAVKDEEPEDDRPADHVELCQAAEYAIARGNTKLLGSLLQAGLSISEPLDLDPAWTALHYSAVHNEPRVARLLIDNGAYLDARDKYGKRPIDYAFEDNQTELCEVLRKPNAKERMTGGYPDALLNELFHPRPEDKNEVRFLSINGNDPSDEQLEYFRKFWPNVRRRSGAEQVDAAQQDKDQAKTSYRDSKTKDYGRVVELSLKDTGDDTFSWSHREASGPSLAGGGSNGKISKKYGYWLQHDTSGWDE